MQPTPHKRRGRPKRNVVDVLRAQVWFLAVESVSEMNANALEIQFRAANNHAQRSAGLWSKYARGDVSPKPKLVEVVEIAYPETSRWFTHPLWALLSDVPITFDELKFHFFALGPEARWLLVFEDRQNEVFWRLPGDIGTTYKERLHVEDIEDALAGLILLVQEAEFRQNAYQFQEGMRAWRLLRQRLRIEWPFCEEPQNQQSIFLTIEELLINRWSRVRITHDGIEWTPVTI